MKRISVLVMGLGLLLIFGLSGCGQTSSEEATQADGKRPANQNATAKPSEKLSTPEKTLASIKAADSRREYSEFCRYFTQDAQRTLAGGLLMSGKDLKRYINNPDNQNLISEEDKALVQGVDNLLKQHGLDRDLVFEVTLEARQDEEVVETKGEQAPTTEQQILQRMGEEISDPCLFVTDFIKTMRTHGQNPDARIIEDDARLDHLKTTDDTAEAELVFTREGREIRRSIGFQNVLGEWHISQVPDVFFK